jgi:hypothetical protein
VRPSPRPLLRPRDSDVVVATSEAGERCRRAMPLALRGKLADLRDEDAIDALRRRIADEVKRARDEAIVAGRNLLVETNVVAMNIEAVAEWAPQKREEKRRERQRERHQWVVKANARRAAYEAEEARRAEEEAARSRPTPRVARPAPPTPPPPDDASPPLRRRRRMLARELARML